MFWTRVSWQCLMLQQKASRRRESQGVFISLHIPHKVFRAKHHDHLTSWAPLPPPHAPLNSSVPASPIPTAAGRGYVPWQDGDESELDADGP